MELSIHWIFWLFPIAVAIHNVEEAFFLPRWSESAGRFHTPVGKFEFRFAVVFLTLLSVIITTLFYMTSKQSFSCYLFFAFNLAMLLNVFFPHFAATIILKEYSPGLLTGLILLLPTTVYLLFYGYDHGFYLFPRFWFIAIPFVALVIASIPVLFKIGKLIQNIEKKGAT